MAEDLFGTFESQRDFAHVDENIETQYECPTCGYDWSGSPNSTVLEDAPKFIKLTEKIDTLWGEEEVERTVPAPITYRCPKCAHEWTGTPRPVADAGDVDDLVFGQGGGILARGTVIREELLDKPPYRVMLMSEIAKMPWNGFNVISTFSGCGGSSLGYKMAGFRVLWASEFIPAAQQCYRLNHPGTILDTRDIRQVKPEDIEAAIGMSGRDIDIMDGSPPCFAAGTLVMTNRGMIPIEDVKVGDEVLTHKKRWRPVVGVSSREASTVIMEDRIEVTPDHLFLARDNVGGGAGIVLGKDAWRPVKNIRGSWCATPSEFAFDAAGDDWVYEDGIRWQRIDSDPTSGRERVEVFDLEVEGDHSFLADTFFVHNCASFSTAGKRDAGWGTVKNYSDSKQRTDDLFFEYSRLVRGLQPKTFVAENVSGLVKGVAKGYFKQILAELKGCGYRVAVKVLDAQYLGVPQMRQRTIFVGVREDLNLDPVHPKPLPYIYTVRDALPWIVKVSKDTGHRAFDAELSADSLAPTVPATRDGGSYPGYYVEGQDLPKEGSEDVPAGGVVADDGCHNPTSGFDKEPKRHEGPCPTIMAGGIGGFNQSQYHLEVERVISVRTHADEKVVWADAATKPSPTIKARMPGEAEIEKDASRDGLNGVIEVERVPVRVVHDTSGHGSIMPEGGAASYSQGDVTDKPCPAITVGVHALNSCHYQVEEVLVPVKPNVEPESDISRHAIGAEWDKIQPGEASEKYFSLVKPDLDKACPTVTQLGSNAGIASVVHPTEKRKFSIGELKQICAFPSDFDFSNQTYAQAWERMGRAVPPVMMKAVAATVRDQILKKINPADVQDDR